jgi:hypothetical protein
MATPMVVEYLEETVIFFVRVFCTLVLGFKTLNYGDMVFLVRQRTSKRTVALVGIYEVGI